MPRLHKEKKVPYFGIWFPVRIKIGWWDSLTG